MCSFIPINNKKGDSPIAYIFAGSLCYFISLGILHHSLRPVHIGGKRPKLNLVLARTRPRISNDNTNRSERSTREILTLWKSLVPLRVAVLNLKHFITTQLIWLDCSLYSGRFSLSLHYRGNSLYDSYVWWFTVNHCLKLTNVAYVVKIPRTMCLDSSIYKSSFCVKVLTPEDNYIYACSSAVLHVRKHVLHMMCPNPLTPTVGVSVSKKRKVYT